MDRSRSLIFIPALNEQATIGAVIKSCRDLCDVLVLDDGSIDNTSQKAKDAGAVVIRNTEPKGYNEAIKKGYEYAVAHDFGIFITADADGQHQRRDIENVLETINADREIAIVIGCRDKYNRISEYFFSLSSWAIFGVRDPLSGLKAYRVAQLSELSESVGANIGTEIVVRVAKLKLKVQQVSIKISPRTDNLSRFGNALSGELRIFAALFSFLRQATLGSNANSNKHRNSN